MAVDLLLRSVQILASSPSWAHDQMLVCSSVDTWDCFLGGLLSHQMGSRQPFMSLWLGRWHLSMMAVKRSFALQLSSALPWFDTGWWRWRSFFLPCWVGWSLAAVLRLPGHKLCCIWCWALLRLMCACEVTRWSVLPTLLLPSASKCILHQCWEGEPQRSCSNAICWIGWHLPRTPDFVGYPHTRGIRRRLTVDPDIAETLADKAGCWALWTV